MVWHSVWPVGTVSVKANRLTGQDNTNYIKDTMGASIVGTNNATVRDHFWDVDPTLDGRHRFIQSPQFTIATLPANPDLGTGMSGVRYIRLVNTDVNKVECFYKNSDTAVGNYPGIYQTSPSFQSGTVSVSSSSVNLGDALPKNVYGEIFMFKLDDSSSVSTIQQGIFKTTGTTMVVMPLMMYNAAESTRKNLIFQNTLLQLLVKLGSDGSSGDWQYRITYRAT